MSEQNILPFAIDLIYPPPTAPKRIFDLTKDELAFLSQMVQTRLPKPPPIPPNTIVLAAGGDLKDALSRMADGMTLLVGRDGKWPDVIQWGWNNAKILVADGPGAPPVFGGLRLNAPVSNVVFDGFTVDAAGLTYGIDWRAAKTQNVAFQNMLVVNCTTCCSVHVPDFEKAQLIDYHAGISFKNVRVTHARAIHPNNPGDTDGQGFFVAAVDGLNFDGCHADDCGGMSPANIFRHGWYLSAYLRNYRISNCAATQCSAFGIQARSDGGIIENCAAYDTGGGIMMNAAVGTVRNNAVVRGHGHAAPWSYGKGGFTFNMGSGDIHDNLVVNGPQTMPNGWWTPPAFNVGYRETKPKDKGGNQDWEWTKLDPKGNQRPLVTMGSANVDRSDVVVSVDMQKMLSLPPNQVAAAIIDAARKAAQ